MIILCTTRTFSAIKSKAYAKILLIRRKRYNVHYIIIIKISC